MISCGGVAIPQALFISAPPRARTLARRWRGTIFTKVRSRNRSPEGLSVVNWILRLSSVRNRTGRPSIVKRSRNGVWTLSVKIAANVNATSSMVKGCPSDHCTPSRRVNVCTRPSGLTLQDSASAGSISPVRMFCSTNPSKTGARRLVDESSAAVIGLKVRGSAICELTNAPPYWPISGAGVRTPGRVDPGGGSGCAEARADATVSTSSPAGVATPPKCLLPPRRLPPTRMSADVPPPAGCDTLDPFQRRVAQRKAFHTPRKMDRHDCPDPFTFDLEHPALAKAGVAHAVAHREREDLPLLLNPRDGWGRTLETGHQVGGNLVEEARGHSGHGGTEDGAGACIG